MRPLPCPEPSLYAPASPAVLSRVTPMDIRASETAMRRARKAFAHATRQLGAAESETSRKRHARRAMNAQRRMAEAVRFYEGLALSEA